MTEEQFNQQETKRLEAEHHKQTHILKTPLPNSVEELLTVFQRSLQETPMLKEFIQREHSENHETLQLMQRQYEKRVNEQNLVVSNLEGEVTSVLNSIKELSDNFNLAMSQLLSEGRLHRERVQSTCDKIDKELTY